MPKNKPTINESFDSITRYSGKWSQYYDIYQTWFQKFQNKSPNVLEIGIMCGGSMEAWKHFFGKGARISGVDNNPRIPVYNEIGPVFVGSQGDEQFLNNFLEFTDPFDCIIDDGSHMQNHQILTFETLFPHMNEGGIYFVEDTHASYMSHFGGVYPDNKQLTFISYCKNIIDLLHEDYIENGRSPEPKWYRHIKSIHFYDSVVVIEKGLRPKAEPTFHNRHLS